MDSFEAQAICDQFNEEYPLGTPVDYWRGAKEGKPSGSGEISHGSYVCESGTPVCFVKGCTGYLAITHVEAVASRQGSQMSGSHELPWFHAPDEGSESWHGPWFGKEQCIEDGRDNGGYEGGFYINQGEPVEPEKFWDAEEFWDRMSDCSEDMKGPMDETWLCLWGLKRGSPLLEDLESKVRKVIRQWRNSNNLSDYYYMIDRKPEFVEFQEQPND